MAASKGLFDGFNCGSVTSGCSTAAMVGSVTSGCSTARDGGLGHKRLLDGRDGGLGHKRLLDGLAYERLQEYGLGQLDHRASPQEV